jgi:hypothetical protein
LLADRSTSEHIRIDAGSQVLFSPSRYDIGSYFIIAPGCYGFYQAIPYLGETSLHFTFLYPRNSWGKSRMIALQKEGIEPTRTGL